MTHAIDELAASLQRLHANGHPSGLGREDAEAFARALATGTPALEAAGRAGLDRRLVEVLAVSGVAEVPHTLSRLLAAMAGRAVHARSLQGAASYPLVLAFCIAVSAGIIFGIATPTLASLPLGGEPTSSRLPLLALILATTLLVALSAAVLGPIRVPGLSRGWRRIDGLAFLECLRILVEAGVALPAAVRAASLWCEGDMKQRGHALARALEAGQPPPETEPLLDPFEAASLVAGAGAGMGVDSLGALVEHRRLALERDVYEEAAKIQATALFLAGGALLAVGAAFLSSYHVAVAG